MITTFKQTIESASVTAFTGDMNTTLGSVTKYAWVSAGVLFACYLYFVGAITFSVIKQEGLAQEIKSIISNTGKEELAYLTTQKKLNEIYALGEGFVSAEMIAYTVPARSFAWNTNARE